MRKMADVTRVTQRDIALRADRRHAVTDFFTTIYRPLNSEESGDAIVSSNQSIHIGKMALFYALFIALLLLIPNDLSGRTSIFFCAFFISSISGLLILIGVRQRRRAELTLQQKTSPFLAVSPGQL